jgi:hypothetical protein
MAQDYTRQCFFDAARRRAGEARVLLDWPERQKQRDGAVTVALLASECALKAMLMHGLQANRLDELPEALRSTYFKSKRGHDLRAIWRELPQRIAAGSGASESDAMLQLHKADRYEHRYGLKRPKRDEAEPYVEAAERLVAWMMKMVT